MTKHRFDVLDSWRGIAAASVALYHISAQGYFYELTWIREAGVFVDFFFLLSGFVIAHSYLERLETAAGVQAFLIKRFGRVWPLHAFALALMIAIEGAKWLAVSVGHLSAGEAAFTGGNSIPAIATNLLLIHSLGIHDAYSWNGPSWSISVEFWTYVVFAILVWHLRRHVVIVALAIILASGFALDCFQGAESYDIGIFRCLYCFFAGILVYLLYRRLGEIGARWATAAEIAAILLLYLFLRTYDALGVDLAQPLVFGIAVLVFAHGRGRISELLRLPAFQKIGEWSYSIYMMHFVILTVLKAGTRVAQQVTGVTLLRPLVIDGLAVDMIDLGPTLVNDLLAAAYLFVVILTSAFTYHLVEAPAREWFNSLAKRIRKI